MRDDCQIHALRTAEHELSLGAVRANQQIGIADGLDFVILVPAVLVDELIAHADPVQGDTRECKFYKMGYPLEDARALVAVLNDAQADSLISRQEYDTIAIPAILYSMMMNVVLLLYVVLVRRGNRAVCAAA